MSDDILKRIGARLTDTEREQIAAFAQHVKRLEANGRVFRSQLEVVTECCRWLRPGDSDAEIAATVDDQMAGATALRRTMMD